VFPHRFIEPELLDHADPVVARANLADLVRINRHFGGHSVIRKLLKQVVHAGESFSVLDVGAASGDTAGVIRAVYPNASVTSLDYNGVNLGAAPAPKVIADAFRLPFGPGTFDFVLSSLFLHHFTNEQVRDLLSSFYQIARRAVLIADLERHVAPYLFLKTTKRLFGWGDITVHDGLISVRAAFRASELRNIAREAGLQDAVVAVHRPAFRLGLVATKQVSEPASQKLPK
jgi:SAM-dependent methyltransferase